MIVDHQVIQRTSAGSAAVVLDEGVAILGDGGAVVAAGRANEQIAVPVGGPYVVQVGGRTVARNVLVGDLWLLAGQSNLQGAGRFVEVEPPSPQVNLLDLARRWRLAEEPLHFIADSPDPVRQDLAEFADFFAEFGRTIGAGPALPFAKQLVRRTGVPVGLVAGCHGGTKIAQWSPGERRPSGDTLYGSLLASVAAAGGRVAGALWIQGESDAVHVLDSPESYGPALAELVAALRADVGTSGFRFLYAQLARRVWETNDGEEARWTAVREVQRRFGGGDGMVAMLDLALDDAVHVSTADLKRLGGRFARLALPGDEPLRILGVELAGRGPIGTGEAMVVRVRYGGVRGGFRPATHIHGFSVRDRDGQRLPRLYEARVDPDDPTAVLVHVSPAECDGVELYYGYGTDPACNLVDAEDNAAPGFGPVPLDSLDC